MPDHTGPCGTMLNREEQCRTMWLLKVGKKGLECVLKMPLVMRENKNAYNPTLILFYSKDLIYLL